MEVAMSLNSLVRLPVTTLRTHEDGLLKNSLVGPRITLKPRPLQPQRHRQMVVVQAKGRKGMIPGRQNAQRPPPLPKIEDDGNPKFVIFTRPTTLSLWFPLSIVTGGATAKVMIAAKDNFLGKYIYKDTLDRNLASVIYKDEKEIQELAIKTHRALRKFTDFRYGYKLVENGKLRDAMSPTNVIQLPTPDKLKTVLDDVKDFFGKAKESFGKLTTLEMTSNENDEPEENSEEKTKAKGTYKRKNKVKS